VVASKKLSVSTAVISLFVALGLFIADIMVPLGVSGGILYLTLLLISLRTSWQRYPLAAALATSVLLILGKALSPVAPDDTLNWIIRAISIFAIGVAAFLFFERNRTNERLLKSLQRYKLAFHGANDGLWTWSLQDNHFYFSPRWKEILGWNNLEIGNTKEEWFNRVHPDDLNKLNSDIQSHLQKHTDHFENEHRLLHKDGTHRWVLARGKATWENEKAPSFMAGSMTDISVRKNEEEQFRIRAVHDQFTQIFNRRHFLERLRIEVQSAKRYGYSLSLCLCDIDSFKTVNDTHGHRAGDRVLARFGRLLSNMLRLENITGRIGGDEFCIVFPHTNAQNAAHSLERIRLHLSALEFEGEYRKLFTTSASFGLAELSDRFGSEKELLEASDQALYNAKAAGRNRIAINESDNHFTLFDAKKKS
jgi:diguanylate cyclase (GGDEF)-like protein/PAS domain S-box-containing protein